MRAVCGSELSYTASFTYRVLRRPFAAGRVASPLSLDTFVKSDKGVQGQRRRGRREVVARPVFPVLADLAFLWVTSQRRGCET
jgi:hypothetical protein